MIISFLLCSLGGVPKLCGACSLFYKLERNHFCTLYGFPSQKPDTGPGGFDKSRLEMHSLNCSQNWTCLTGAFPVVEPWGCNHRFFPSVRKSAICISFPKSHLHHSFLPEESVSWDFHTGNQNSLTGLRALCAFDTTCRHPLRQGIRIQPPVWNGEKKCQANKTGLIQLSYSSSPYPTLKQ